ncbi:DNA-processing protein DprA [Candidatus Gracilibacteria bacterium]|nr:DNA-processing protein DprA [Candidatus Gracilibacteria bacterium]
MRIAFLHSCGFTQKDLKKLHVLGYDFDLQFDSLREGKGIAMPWITEERKIKISESSKKISFENLEKVIEEKNIKILLQSDLEYPKRLQTIKQSPFILYVRGNIEEKKLTLGIVGSRKSTSYGKKVLEHIIPSIISVNAAIVSGGAFGIDSLSHQIALQYGGYTLSVFGCGVDVYYPPQNEVLFDSILRNNGALVSIFPIGTLPEPYNFPIRNEIVAALSDGIIIAEAGLKSGTLITAGLALEHGRDVFAIPGDIFRETSSGTNMLIATGQAKAVQGPEGILEEYFPTLSQTELPTNREKEFDTSEQKDIYTAIQNGFDTPDILQTNTQFPITTITMTLSLLEIEGHIELGKNGKYQILS